MKTTNNGNAINVDLNMEQFDNDALKKRIVAYSRLSEVMRKAADVMRKKGAKA